MIKGGGGKKFFLRGSYKVEESRRTHPALEMAYPTC